MNEPGVYAIVNSVKGRMYVGSTKSLERRRSRHASLLRMGSHYSLELQKDFDSLGSEFILFKVLVVMKGASKEDLLNAEQSFIDSIGIDNLYNYCPSAKDWSGAKHRPDTLEKIRNRPVPEHIRELTSKRFKGKPLSCTQRMNISLGTKGKPKNPDHAEKLRKACIERNLASAKTWRVVSPDGVEAVITNLNAFCKAQGLDQSAMQRVAVGKVRQHKGWRCFYDTERHQNQGISRKTADD